MATVATAPSTGSNGSLEQDNALPQIGSISKEVLGRVPKPDDPNPSADAAAFWSGQFRPTLSALLKNVGSYTIEEQASHLKFFEDHVARNLGPVPDKACARSLLTPNGSPFEASINLSDVSNPCVRFTFEPYMSESKCYEDTPLPSIAAAIGADMRWAKEFAEEFFETQEEREALLRKMPRDTMSIPRCILAFDLDSGTRTMKAYFYPIIKSIAAGLDSDRASVNLLKRLETNGNGFTPGLNYIEEWRPICQTPATIQVIGIDCIEPALGARAKIYMHPENTFDSVRDHVTLGGKRQDEMTIKGLRILREMWHLLLGAPEKIVTDSYSKEVNVPKSGHKGMCLSWELRPGQVQPDMKVYVPLFQYFSSDRTIAENLGKAFKMRGWSWGIDGGYEEMLETAFAKDVVSESEVTPLVHSYVSFNFSEKKGAYMSTYLDPFLCFE